MAIMESPPRKLLVIWITSAILCLQISWKQADCLQTEYCQAQTQEVTVNPKANAFINVLLGVRKPGEDGLFACGQPERVGVEIFEAMRWAVYLLNGKDPSGKTQDVSGNSSFIPGITFGLRVFDTCGHSSSTELLLADAFPVLRDGPAPCAIPSSSSSSTPGGEPLQATPLAVGLADGTGVATRQQRVHRMLQRFYIPALELNPVTLVPAEDRAKALIMLAQQLGWRRVAVLYAAKDDYSARMFRTVVRLSSDASMCLIAAADASGEEDEKSGDSNRRALTAIFSASNTHKQGSTPSGLGVIVLVNPSDLTPVLRMLHELTTEEDSRQLKWLFSRPLTGEQLRYMGERESFAVSLSPALIPEFEGYWKSRREDVRRTPDSNWFVEYEMRRRGCRFPGWAGPGISDLPRCHETKAEDVEGPEETVARASNAVAGIHVVHTFAHALRSAWETSCGHAPGPCPALIDMQRREFFESYLSPLEFEHKGDGNLIPGAPVGGKLKAGNPSHLAAARMGLVAYRRGLNGEVLLKEVYAYHLEAVEVLDSEFQPEAITCAESGHVGACEGCLRVREGRVEGGAGGDLHRGEKDSAPTPLLLVPSPQNLYVAGIFSLRNPGAGQLSCGDEVTMESVRQVEAFMWALRRFNERLQSSTPGSPRLGAILLDTCSSRVRSLTLPAGLLSDGSGRVPPHVVAAVNALPLPDAEAAAGVLSALNVSSVATGEASSGEETRSHFSLQVEAPLSMVSAAIIRILQYLGWSYISIVYSAGDAASEAGLRAFREAADNSGICISLEVGVSEDNSTISGLATNLVGARAAGARGVVLWTNTKDTHSVMRAMSTAHAQGTLRREDVFWLVASPTGEAREIFEEYGNAVGGALIFSPLHRPVREFLQHLRRVRPNGPWENENPWLQRYIQEVVQCKEPECRRILESGRPTDANTVQAVFAIGSAIVRARKELCPGSKSSLDGLCPASAKVNRAAVNRAVNAYLRYSSSERADGTSGEEFRLTAEGAGDVPVEILNFRRGPRGRSRSLGNVYYESVGLFQQQLKTLTNMVTYRDSGDEVQVSTLASQCAKHCQRCRHRSMDRMTTTVLQKDDEFDSGRSVETFYLAAALGVHEPSPRPLECSSEVSTDGMLQLEALLWAVEQANRNGSLLPPSVRLATLALDTCNSAQKTARDVANLVGEAETGDKGGQTATKAIAATRMVAFIAGGGTEVTKPAVDILAPLGIAVLAPEATGSVLRRRKKHAPYPLQLSPGNAARASALVALLSRLQWTSFSVVYLEDGIEYEDIFLLVEKEARGRGLRLATASGLPVTEAGDELGLQSAREALRQVERRRAEGVKAVLLLLPPKEVDLLLRTARSMRNNGQMAPGGIIWVGVGSEDVFETHRDQAQGALILRPKVGWVEEFEKHFKDLNISSNIQNPWFPDFWASVFHCRGAACRSGLYRNLHSYYVKQNPYVVNTINAVFAIAHALESVHRELCPDHLAGLCKAMKDVGRVKRRLFEVAPRMAFVGAGLNGVAFTHGGENSHAGLEVLNVRQVGSAVWGLVSVGSVSTLLSPQASSERDEEGDELVKIDITRAKAYEIENSKSKEIPITEIISQCVSCDRPEDSLWEEPKLPESKQNFMEVVSNRRFSILAFIPLHEEGANYLHCGSFKSLTMYKTAAAFGFALERINKNTSILPGIKLGALLWDYCSQPARAHDRLFTFFSRNSEAVASPESALAALVIGTNTAESLAPILQAQGIPQLMDKVDDEDQDEPYKQHSNALNNALHLSVDESGEVESLISIVQMLKWDYVVIIHSTSTQGNKMMNHMKMRAIENEICIGSIFPVSIENSDKDMVHAVSTLKQLSSATVVILLLDSQKETNTFLDTVGKQGVLRERFTFLAGSGWSGRQNVPQTLEQISAGSIVVGQEEWEIPGFEEYFNSLLMSNFTSKDPYNAPLPVSWNNEAQELLASCVNGKDKDIDRCTAGKLKISKNSPLYLSTVKAVSVIATTLHRFLDKNCSHGFDASSISSCGPQAREKLGEEIKIALEEEGLGRLFIWNVHGREMIKVGWWSPKRGLHLDVDKLKFRHSSQIPSAECTSGSCIRVCAEQMPRYAAKAIPIRPLPLDGAGTLEGVITSALTVFGFLVAFVIFVIQCIPSHGRRPTSPSFPLNFLILFGVVLLFCSNFAFILSATEVICSTRRSLPGIAYSTILAGLLVEVVDRWRRYSENKPLKEVNSCHPIGLLMSTLALILVQAFLATGWLLLVSSMIEPLEVVGDLESNKSPMRIINSIDDKEYNEPHWMAPLWRCSPASNFEAHFLLSMSYNLLLLIATSLLVLCIRRQGRRQEVFMGIGKKKERRSQIGVEGGIIACCSLMWIIWIVGIIASLVLPYKRREVVIIVADLLSGMVVLCTLFVRDAYATSRKKIKHKEETMTVAAIPGLNSRFPYPQPIFSISHFKAQHGFVTETGTGEEDPTQVVPSLLYPLDMFSQTSQSMDDCEEDELQGLGDDDDDNEGQINESFEDTDDDKDSWSQNMASGIIPAHLTIPDHREPGTNEFTAPEDEDIPRSLMATAKGQTHSDRLDPFSL